MTKTGPKILIVTQKSVTSTGLTAAAEENNVSFNIDHSELVKYRNWGQKEYTIVQNKLRVVVAEAIREVSKRFTEKGALLVALSRATSSDVDTDI